ncbi:hypothetical protein ACET3Z_005384 [Daucus carota]
MGSNGNKRGSKRKAGRPKNKMKRIDDLGKKSEEIVRDSTVHVDQRTVLDLDAIVRDYISRTREFCKDGQEICVVSSSDDDENQNHANKIKDKEIVVGGSGKDDDNDDQNHKNENKDNEIVISSYDDDDDDGAEDDDQKIRDEHDVEKEATAPQCEEHDGYLPEEALSSAKRRKNSAMGKDDEKIQKIGSRGRNNKEKGKDGQTSRVCKSAGSKRKGG